MDKKYNCQVYYILCAFLYILTAMILTWGVIFILVRYVHILPALGVLLIIATMVLPFVYQKKIKKYFTRDCVIVFDDNGFLIQTSCLHKKTKETSLNYNWNEIKALKFNISPSNLMTLSIFCFHKKHSKFTFLDYNNETKSSEQKLLDIFLKLIAQYNKKENANNRIMLLEGFFATKFGLTVLWIIGILIIIDVFLHFLKYDNNIGTLIIAIVFYLPLLGLRKQQKNFYEKIINTDRT